MGNTSISMNALVLVNSASAGYREGIEGVLPYLEHLGVPHVLVDLAGTPLPGNVADYALVIIAHRQMDPRGVRLGREGRCALLAAVGQGAGLVSFDPQLPSAAEIGAEQSANAEVEAGSVEFASRPHFITIRHEPEEELALAGPLNIPSLAATEGGVLLRACSRPLMATARLGHGRVVQWATAGWMHSGVLGPVAGLDDVLWRGLVWAARKPFALRGLAPLVSMRVDDVAGRGILFGQSPLYWVHIANRQGFKPWLGLFIYNLAPETVNELRDLISRGQATGFPHAFGRASQPDTEPFFQWDAEFLRLADGEAGEFERRNGRPPLASDLDRFIYFDHLRGQPWPEAEIRRRLAAVDDWYAAHAPLAMSRLALPHWYEMGRNVVAHIHDRWGAEFVGQPNDVETRFIPGTRWLPIGPFRRYEEPQSCHMVSSGSGHRPVYYADWINFGGRRFFNCLTEIRDITGYEWQPDNDVAGTVSRGTRQLRRAFDSMALPVLFTHETDHIYRIRPDNWVAEIAQVARGIADYSPIYVTLDEAVRYVRATRTSRLSTCTYDPQTSRFSASFTGCADVATHFYLFREAGPDIEETLVDVPAFDGQAVVITEIPTSERGE